MTGSIMGPAKHVCAMSWMLGSAVYGMLLARPLLEEFDPKRAAAAVFVPSLLISLALSVQPPNESDESDYVAAALALARTGSMRVDRVVADGSLEQFYFGRLQPTWLEYHEQFERGTPPYLWSLRMIGYPMMLAPFALLARCAAFPTLRWFLVYIPGLPAYLLLAVALASILRKMSSSCSLAFTATATMTPFLYFITNAQPEIWMAAGVAWMTLFWMRHRDDGASPLPLALTAAALVLLHERMIVIAAPMIFCAAISSSRRGALVGVFLVALLPAVLSYTAVLQFSMPHALPHAYGFSDEQLFAPSRWLRAFLAHLFSPSIGMLARLPTLALLFAGLPLLRGAESPSTMRTPIAVFAVYFAVIITYPRTFDSWPHLRYMMPALPLLTPWLGATCDRIQARPGGALVIRAAIALQWILAWPFLAVPHLWRSVM